MKQRQVDWTLSRNAIDDRNGHVLLHPIDHAGESRSRDNDAFRVLALHRSLASAAARAAAAQRSVIALVNVAANEEDSHEIGRVMV
jgi:hypothetical protein